MNLMKFVFAVLLCLWLSACAATKGGLKRDGGNETGAMGNMHGHKRQRCERERLPARGGPLPVHELSAVSMSPSVSMSPPTLEGHLMDVESEIDDEEEEEEGDSMDVEGSAWDNDDDDHDHIMSNDEYEYDSMSNDEDGTPAGHRALVLRVHSITNSRGETFTREVAVPVLRLRYTPQEVEIRTSTGETVTLTRNVAASPALRLRYTTREVKVTTSTGDTITLTRAIPVEVLRLHSRTTSTYMEHLEKLASDRQLQVLTASERRDIAREAGSTGVELEILEGGWMDLYVFVEKLLIHEIARLQASDDSHVLWWGEHQSHKYTDHRKAYGEPMPRPLCAPAAVKEGDRAAVVHAQYSTANRPKKRPLDQSLEPRHDGTFESPTFEVARAVVNNIAASHSGPVKSLDEFMIVKDVLLGVTMPYGFDMDAFLTHLKNNLSVVWEALLHVHDLLDERILTVLRHHGVEEDRVSHLFMGTTQRNAHKEGRNFHTKLAKDLVASPDAILAGIPHFSVWITPNHVRLGDESRRRADDGFSILAQLATGNNSLVSSYARDRAEGINIDGITALLSAQSAELWSQLDERFAVVDLTAGDIKAAGIRHSTEEELQAIDNYTPEEVAAVKEQARQARQKGGRQSIANAAAAGKPHGISAIDLKLAGLPHKTMEDFQRIARMTPTEVAEAKRKAQAARVVGGTAGGRASIDRARVAGEPVDLTAIEVKLAGLNHTTEEQIKAVWRMNSTEVAEAKRKAEAARGKGAVKGGVKGGEKRTLAMQEREQDAIKRCKQWEKENPQSQKENAQLQKWQKDNAQWQKDNAQWRKNNPHWQKENAQILAQYEAVEADKKRKREALAEEAKKAKAEKVEKAKAEKVEKAQAKKAKAEKVEKAQAKKAEKEANKEKKRKKEVKLEVTRHGRTSKPPGKYL